MNVDGQTFRAPSLSLSCLASLFLILSLHPLCLTQHTQLLGIVVNAVTGEHLQSNTVIFNYVPTNLLLRRGITQGRMHVSRDFLAHWCRSCHVFYFRSSGNLEHLMLLQKNIVS